MHIFSDAMGRSLRSGLAGWLRAVVSGRARMSKLHGVKRADFDQIAADLDLSLPELYELLTGRRLSADALEDRLAAEFEASPQLAKRLRKIEQQRRAARIRASVPIGPSCC